MDEPLLQNSHRSPGRTNQNARDFGDGGESKLGAKFSAGSLLKTCLILNKDKM